MTTNITLPNQIVSAIRSVIGTETALLHEPSFNGNEWNYVKECLDSSYVSSIGKFVEQFEGELTNYTGAKYAIAVVNGTAALHIALLLAGVSNNDEVLIPALTFVATANAVSYCGASPHLVDSEEKTLGMDPIALREYLNDITEIRNKQCINRHTGNVIRAIVPMHTFGHPVDIAELKVVAHDFCLEMIEDAAESLGSYVDGKHTGTFGLMGTFSFNGNKTITTGGGGAIITNDEDLARRAKHITTTAKLRHMWKYVHDEVGYNYRMPNINAALGCAQLEQLSTLLSAKRHLFKRYQKAFENISQVSIVKEPNGCQSNYWLQTILLNNSVTNQRDIILDSTNEAGFMTRPSWTLMNDLEPYKNSQKMELSVAESLQRRIINLPSSAHLDMDKVC